MLLLVQTRTLKYDSQLNEKYIILLAYITWNRLLQEKSL